MHLNNKLVEIKNLKKYFKIDKQRELWAVDGISFDIYRGETLGLIGESGCGKTTLGRIIIRLYGANEGQVIYNGKAIHSMNNDELKDFTKDAQMIFQNPYSSLNPRMTIGDIVGEGIDIHKLYKGDARTKKIYELLEIVGLSSEYANRFPHEFSGGQRQRIGIARALAIKPKFIICDEPISALDVSIQAQIINLLIKLQREMGLTYLFIAHDLSMIKHISDRIAVMYSGRVVELTNSKELYKNPIHPYTQMLLSSLPYSNNIGKEKDETSLGCNFKERCRYAMDICYKNPEFKEYKPGHFVACHLIEQK